MLLIVATNVVASQLPKHRSTGTLTAHATMKNNLHSLKQILYGMGHLTAARWFFQKGWKFKIFV